MFFFHFSNDWTVNKAVSHFHFFNVFNLTVFMLKASVSKTQQNKIMWSVIKLNTETNCLQHWAHPPSILVTQGWGGEEGGEALVSSEVHHVHTVIQEALQREKKKKKKKPCSVSALQQHGLCKKDAKEEGTATLFHNAMPQQVPCPLDTFPVMTDLLDVFVPWSSDTGELVLSR